MTITRTVKGAWSDGRCILPLDVTVRVTKDTIGATISLSDEHGLMLLVPVEPLADIIKVKEA